MKKTTLILALLSLSLCSFADKTETLTSPNGSIKLEVNIGDRLTYNVFRGNEQILKDCEAVLQVGQEQLGVKPKLSNARRTKIDEIVTPVVPLKFAQVENKANQLSLSFKGGYSVEFRAYDNGVAYRYVLNKGKGKIDVVAEPFTIALPAAFTAHISRTRNFNTSYESNYLHLATVDYMGSEEITYLPILLESPRGTLVLLSESDVRDYPHTFLKSNNGNGFAAIHPLSPETWEPRGDRSWTITKEYACIARTDATRTLPWRFAVIGDETAILTNQMEVILGGKCELADVSWIKPGQVNWDWWNHWTVWDVDFEAGINNNTYKYIIDCASKYGVEYILLDEGWNKRVEDPFVTLDDIDVKELVDYGREKNVGVFLWLSWLTVHHHMDLIKYYADMGVKGLKVDFMDHSDQWMVNFLDRVASECSKNKLLVDFHGSFKPAGMEQRLPNVISYEGVRGMEYNNRCLPENSIWLPFMRNAVGPMDFTPGSMQSTQPEDNHGTGSLPMGNGTRAYQMAQYVCFESGLQMLADSPTRYLREDECTRYIASVPTTWDETRVLAAKAGQYYAVAKRKGSQWFIGAITGSDAQDLELPFDFLTKPGHLTYFRDGANAHRIAVDYKKVDGGSVGPQDKLKIHLVRNGGWCGVIE